MTTSTQVKMPLNLSMSTSFVFFRNSDLRTAHEHVLNSFIVAYMYIHLLCLCWTDSYQESKPGNEKRESEVSSCCRVIKHRRKPSHSRTKRKSLMIIRIQEARFPLLGYNLPARAGKVIGTSSSLAGGKSRVLPTDFV